MTESFFLPRKALISRPSTAIDGLLPSVSTPLSFTLLRARGPEARDGAPEFLDDLNWILDPGSEHNRQIRVVDGADPAVGLDVGRTAPDRGAYGGPWGEAHSGVTLQQAAPGWPLAILAMGLALAGVRRRRR